MSAGGWGFPIARACRTFQKSAGNVKRLAHMPTLPDAVPTTPVKIVNR